MCFEPSQIRNIAIVGHQGSGKTTLVESIAFKTGLIHSKGSIEKKNTISDFSEDEKKKQMSLSSSVIPVIFDNHKLNIIDTPGNDDYIYETIGITKLIKGAVLVIDASKGVQIGTVKTFNLLKKRGVPIFIFINKMDKENVDFNSLLAEIQEKLDNKKCFPFSYPIGRKENFDGFVNLVDLKARKYNGKSCEDDIIYDDKKQIVFQLHNRLCEAVATTNDEMLEHFFSGIPLTKEEIKSGLRTGVLSGELYPVLVGSAMKDIGINTLLNMMIDYLPSPIDLKPIKATDSKNEIVEIKTDEKERTSIQIFKNHFNPYQGNISIFKVQSGTVKFGDELYCPNNQKTYKMTSLFSICADKLKPTTSISAGDIGAATKLDDVKLSYTLSDPLNPITFSLIKYPTPVYFRRIIPATKKDLDKLFPAVSRLALENPTISIEKQETPDQILLGGLSTTHLNYVLEKLEGEYAIDFETQQPKISYREAITSASEAEGRYIKQTGGSGYYGVVTMRFQPSDKTEFCSKVFGGHVDKSYFPAVEKGFLEALKEGGLIHAPVINVKATLLDGKQHSVDSNEMAFKNAAILAFREAYKNCNPVLLEPFSRIVINIPIDYLGPVLSDLTKKRARILSTEETNGNTIDITAITPESEIIDYANELKSFSKGTGFFNTSFFGYEELPKVLAEKVMQENK